MNKVLLAAVFFVTLLAGYFMYTLAFRPVVPNNEAYSNTNFYVLGLNIPSKLDFCGEKIPSNDMGIKKGIEKEFINSSYWKVNSHILFNKTQRWFPFIEPILKEEGVPNDFKYLAVIESHLSNASSPAGAAGFWQLVASSAYNYGLEVNDYVDERYHVEKATRAACKHIKEAYAVFNNWTLAAAAYNLGINGILSALKKQKTNNYYDLLLNSETGSFVYRILAFKTLLSNPAHFGIARKKNKIGFKVPFKIYKVDSIIHDLSHLARHIGVSVATIKQFNPWILRNEINNASKKTYEIRLPKSKKTDYSSYLNDLARDETPVAASTIPSVGANYETLSDTTAKASRTIYYVVKVEEPLKNVADFFKVKLEDLCKWNNLNVGDRAVKGQTLTINY